MDAHTQNVELVQSQQHGGTRPAVRAAASFALALAAGLLFLPTTLNAVDEHTARSTYREAGDKLNECNTTYPDDGQPDTLEMKAKRAKARESYLKLYKEQSTRWRAYGLDAKPFSN